MPGFALLLAASAVRVASLNMCADEYLLLLARPQEIASVSRLSRDPADSSLWRLGQRFPGNRGDLGQRAAFVQDRIRKAKFANVVQESGSFHVIDLPPPVTLPFSNFTSSGLPPSSGATRSTNFMRAL